MATNYLKPQEPLQKIDKKTRDINYIYPFVTDDQVILEDETRLNIKLNDLTNKFDGCWISFTDENDNLTSESYIHWNEEV